jgi:hypothetical protein
MASENPTNTILQNQTANLHVAMIVRLLDRVVKEVCESQSSPLTGTRLADYSRIDQYLTELESFTDFANKLPEADYPKSHPLPVQLNEPMKVPAMDNDSLWLLAQLVDTARFEVANSNSSRSPSGFVPADYVRWTQYYSDIRRLVKEHMKVATPTDKPESTPTYPLPAKGALGV